MKNKLHGEIKTVSLIFMLSIASTGLFANNLTVTNLAIVNQAAGTVSFTITWANSWRTLSAPTNNDAAWVFIKFRDCAVSDATQFTHGQINTTITNHTFTNNGGFANVEPILKDGSATGIDAATNNTGIMLRPDANGTGAINADVTLLLNNLPAAGTLDIRVYGIEMVFIPQGGYQLGDGDNVNGSYNSFSSTNTTSYNAGHTSYPVAGEGGFSFLYWNGAVNQSLAINAGFPKGYAAFHIMKYEISQGQYTAFLNGITPTQASSRFYSSGANRYTITGAGVAPTMYSCTRPNRACNWLSPDDLMAYLDWAALRPVNELMYEKAARGSGGITLYEPAWGSNTVRQATTISGAENGTETVTNVPEPNVNAGSVTFTGGDASAGPLRAGIFSEPTDANRLETGASYFGVMELSGNVYENVVLANNSATVWCSTLGDGSLSSTGFQNTGAAAGCWTGAGFMSRGGAWDDAITLTGSSTSALEVSNRFDWGGISSSLRYNNGGGRGAR